jgi:hypothetical protein
MGMYGIIDLYQNSLSHFKIKENREMILYSAIAFSFPFFLPKFQLLLGSVVNTTLVLSAFYLKGKNVLPLIFLPSIGTLLNGVLFGPFTPYLLYLLPFIWIGNALLIGGIKLFYIKLGLNYNLSSIISIAAKTSFLFASAYILFSLNIIPQAFLIAMGLIQVITATIGCFSAYSLNFARKKLSKG